jgi:hypothetical protein
MKKIEIRKTGPIRLTSAAPAGCARSTGPAG